MYKSKNKVDSKGLLSALFKNNESDVFTSDYGVVKEYYLSSQIGDPDEYTQWFNEIRNCRPTDIIKIHINCNGGNLFTTIQFLQVLSECQGHIIASVEGSCMSAATLIFLCADEYQITNHSMFLFHNYSGGTFGKGGEMYHGMVHERKWGESLMRDIYEDFLTEAEISDMINDKDIWMDAHEVQQRLENRGKIAQMKNEEAEKVKKSPKTKKKS